MRIENIICKPITWIVSFEHDPVELLMLFADLSIPGLKPEDSLFFCQFISGLFQLHYTLFLCCHVMSDIFPICFEFFDVFVFFPGDLIGMN